MVATIVEMLEQKPATADDAVYPASYHNKEGYLTLFNQKLTFFELRGFIQPRYHKLLEIPFTQIESIDNISHNTLVITQTNGYRHYLTVYDAQSMTLTKTISDVIINDMIITGIHKFVSE